MENTYRPPRRLESSLRGLGDLEAARDRTRELLVAGDPVRDPEGVSCGTC